jgi:hypothetical protein
MTILTDKTKPQALINAENNLAGYMSACDKIKIEYLKALENVKTAKDLYQFEKGKYMQANNLQARKPHKQKYK